MYALYVVWYLFNFVLRAFYISIFWKWFVVKQFTNFPLLGPAHFIGVLLLLQLFKTKEVVDLFNQTSVVIQLAAKQATSSYLFFKLFYDLLFATIIFVVGAIFHTLLMW
jgi:hypothetical protein